MKNTLITIYKNVFTEEANHITIEKALERIKTGRSEAMVKHIRSLPTKDEQNAIKINLPAICFSGIIPTGKREDARLEKHSGLVTLDFDELTPDVFAEKKRFFANQIYTVAAFLSPRGNGLKILIKIADKTKHKEHYGALLKEFAGLDRANINPSRVCFESYDPEIFINYDAEPYTTILTSEKEFKANVTTDALAIFRKLEKWLQSKNEAFTSGNRNIYIFNLAGACCRYGVSQSDCEQMMHQEYLANDSTFRLTEMVRTIKSAYKKNESAFGTCEFSNETFIEKQTRKEIKIDLDSPIVEDVIYGQSVLDEAMRLYHFGYESAESTGIPQIDNIFKWKKGELTILSGIGNHGKSEMLKFLILNKTVADKTKWALFSPENFPAHEFYHSLVETALGTGCTPQNYNRPDEETYRSMYQFISEHFFYIYPKELAPTPEYIKSRFLQLILKEKVQGCIIDPFNQMSNDYNSNGGRDDKYLETFLADICRFALANNIFFVVISHPHKLKKNDSGGYDAPEVFDLAGGAMWNNKADNILIYHRPNRYKDPTDPICELHSRKIRRQNIVANVGTETFEYSYPHRRFMFAESNLKKFSAANKLQQEPEVRQPKLTPIKNYSEPQNETPF